MRRYNKGWTQESERHSLARRGIKTGKKLNCLGLVLVGGAGYVGYKMGHKKGERKHLRAEGKRVAKISYKKYQCQRCGHVMDIQTNHYGECYPSCPNCSWKNPLDPQSTFKCVDKIPKGAWIPEPWKKVKLGDVVDDKELKEIVDKLNKKKHIAAKGRKVMVGLNTYHVTFKTRKEQQDFIDENNDKYDIEEIFVNNAYGLEIRKRRHLMAKGMLVKPKLDYHDANIVGKKKFPYALKKNRTYKADVAVNQPDYEKDGKIFVGELLLKKGEYTIVRKK